VKSVFDSEQAFEQNIYKNFKQYASEKEQKKLERDNMQDHNDKRAEMHLVNLE
jgi:hypothetical protein